MSDRKIIAYRLTPVYEPPKDATAQFATAALMTCLATGRTLAGMGGGGDFLAPEVVDGLRNAGKVYAEDGANEIVRRVNTHEELVATLEDARLFVADAANPEDDLLGGNAELLERIDGVLAKVKGEGDDGYENGNKVEASSDPGANGDHGHDQTKDYLKGCVEELLGVVDEFVAFMAMPDASNLAEAERLAERLTILLKTARTLRDSYKKGGWTPKPVTGKKED